MATDDVHDLFDTGDEDSDGSTDDERADTSTESSGSGDHSSPGDAKPDEPADPSGDGTADRTATNGGDDDPTASAQAEDVHDLFGREPADESDPAASANDGSGATDGRTRPDGFQSSERPERPDDAVGEEGDASASATSGRAATDDRNGPDSGDVIASSGEGAEELFGGSNESATPIEGGAEDDAEPGEATISSDDVETEEGDEAASGGESVVGEEGTIVGRPSSEDGGGAGTSDGTTASERSGPESGGPMGTAEAPSTGESDPSEPDGEATLASGTAADEGGPSTSAAGSSALDDGFVTASPTEPEEPAVDAETASSSLSDSGRLSTGVDVLDEAMGGGVPPGRLVVLVADPGVQSELIVDSVLTQRDTLYVTTDRPDWEVQKDIEPGLGSGEITVEEHTPDSLLSGVDSLLDQIGTTSNFVLDSVNELELVERGRYRIFLSDVKRRLFDTGSVGLLTGVSVDHDSARDLTLRRADIVWRIETRTTGGELEHWLSVPKFRGGAAMTETVKLELTDQVEVDPEWQDG